MEINYSRGRKHTDDRIIYVTADKENVTMFRVSLLVNQLAINEEKIHPYTWQASKLELTGKGLPFFFEELMYQAANDGKKGIDWADPAFEDRILEVFRSFKLRKENIDYDLLNRAQTRLSEFKEKVKKEK